MANSKGAPQNLKPPWKPGQSGNPQGGKKHKNLRKKILELNNQELKELGDLIILGNLRGLEEIVNDAKTDDKGGTRKKYSVLTTWIANAAVKAISKGDLYSLDVLLNRLVGKVPQPIKAEHSGSVGGNTHTVLILPSNNREKLSTSEEPDGESNA